MVYRSLRAHLSYAALEGLVNSHSWDSSVSLTAPAYACDQVVNHWSVLCDVNLCLEATITAASPSGYAIDTMKEGVIVLPTPSASTANILPLEKFTFAAIPYRNEYISAEVRKLPVSHSILCQISNFVCCIAIRHPIAPTSSRFFTQSKEESNDGSKATTGTYCRRL